MTQDFHAIAPHSEWLLDPDATFLNHGSFGATPKVVLAEQDRWRERLERQPTTFMSFEVDGATRHAAEVLARFVKAEGEDLVFIENATAGCNAVLNSFAFAAGDEILLTNHGYAAVRKAAEHVAGRTGARVVEAQVPFPIADEKQVVDAVASRLSSKTRFVILDHITSPTAIIFPVRALTALCRAAGAAVLVDGAHAPGMLPLDVPAIDADWYVGNCHKWLMAPKGAGFLWTSRARQKETHPLVISHGYRKGYTAEFDWIGTRDPSGWLSVPAAIDFHMRLGGMALQDRNMALARAAATGLAAHWRSERGAPDALTGSMAAIRLPIAGEATPERCVELRKWLFKTYRIELAMTAFAGALWARISAQAYNESADYQRLADVRWP